MTKWFGVIRRTEGTTDEVRLFPPEASAIADRLQRLRDGQILEEEQALAAPDLVVTEPRLAALGRVDLAAGADAAAPEGYTAGLLRASVLELARRDAQRRSGQADRFVAHAVKAMDELTRSMNTLVERLREWYGLYEPDAARQGSDQAAFAQALVGRLRGLEPRAEALGAPLAPEQAEDLASFAEAVARCYAERSRMEARVATEVARVAPTLAALTGAFIAARLIAHAGSLERLAFLPASTVQTLGAEQALFAHLRQGHRPPKHGVLFQHHLVNTAPPRVRGRIARSLAALAVQAARSDHFVAEDPASEARRLAGRLEARVAQARRRPARSGPVAVPAGRRR